MSRLLVPRRCRHATFGDVEKFESPRYGHASIERRAQVERIRLKVHGRPPASCRRHRQPCVQKTRSKPRSGPRIAKCATGSAKRKAETRARSQRLATRCCRSRRCAKRALVLPQPIPSSQWCKDSATTAGLFKRLISALGSWCCWRRRATSQRL